MILKKEELSKIISYYDLGIFKKLNHIKEGEINENFELVTDKGEFIIQILGNKLDKQKNKQMDLQFMILKSLNKKGFSYLTPLPIKNKKKKYLLNLNGKNLWVYRKINGKFHKKYTKKKLFESGKALALFHQNVKDLKTQGRQSYNYIFKILQDIHCKNKQNKDAEGIFDIYSNLRKTNFEGKLIPIHADFNKTNILFSDDKLVGIIDFDNLEHDFYIRDISLSLMRLCTNRSIVLMDDWNNFLRGYNSIKKISKKDAGLITPNLIRMKCYLFSRAFLKKDSKEIRDIINLIKRLQKTKTKKYGYIN